LSFESAVCRRAFIVAQQALGFVARVGSWEENLSMGYLKRIGLSTVFMFLALSTAFSQSASQESKQGTGGISGRVTVGGNPARGVTVMAIREEIDNPQLILQRLSGGLSDMTIKVKTDEDGHFRFAELAAADYRVFVQAPAMVGVKSSTPAQKTEPPKAPPTIVKRDEDDDDDEDDEDEEYAAERQRQLMDSPTRHVTLSHGQTVENINFSLTRGGVITGRVTYADGRPVIGEAVSVSRTQGNANSQTFPLGMNGMDGFTTDDRGIYRIYGLADGRYKISVHMRSLASSIGYGNSGLHKRTFYPDVTDETAATAIEISSGSEVRNIDIKIGVAGKTYIVTGRVVEAETGKAVPEVSIVFEKARHSAEGNSNGLTQANSKGEFRLEGVTSGAYVAYSLDGFLKQSDFYGEPLKFEVKDGNLSGIILKMRRGLIISGVVAIDGAGSPEATAKLTQQTLAAVTMDEKMMNARDDQNDEQMEGVSVSQSPISADGSFMLKGLKAGKVQIGLGGFITESPFAISRIERSGIEQQAGLELRANESISDVRIVVAQKNCVIRGRVIIEGTLPKNARLQISAERITQGEPQGFPNLFGSFRGSQAQVDAKGEFKFEGLIPGEYEVKLIVGGMLDLDDDDPRPPTTQQQVSVTSDREAEVTLVLTVKSKGK
jgi:hypothetical protein